MSDVSTLDTTPGRVLEVDDATFADVVLASDRPVIVEFWATWCGPCRMLAPILAEVAAEHANSVRVVKIDTDLNPGTMTAYGVLAVPAVMVFVDGQPAASLVGARPKRALLAELAPYLAD